MEDNKLNEFFSDVQNFVEDRDEVAQESGWGVAFDTREYLLIYDGESLELNKE